MSAASPLPEPAKDAPEAASSGDDAPLETRRLKAKVAEAFRNPAFAAELERRLEAEVGCTGVSVSSLTGTVKLVCDTRFPADALDLAVAACRGEDGLKRTVPATRPSAEPATPSPAAAPAMGPAWHAMELGEVLEALGADGQGLTTAQARSRRLAHGPNALPEPIPPSALALFAGQFNTMPVMLLLGSAGLSVATGGVIDAVVTLAVVLANAGIGYSTESAAQKAILAMTRHRAWPVRVKRDGHEMEIASDEIVPGDVLVLAAGTIVAADARVSLTDDLLANEALLTGESEPVEKHAGAVAKDAALANRSSIVRRGTFIASGSGEAVVVATGAETEIGRIEVAAAGVAPPPTVLEQDLGRLGSQLTLISALVCAGVLGLGVLRGRSLLLMLKSSVALAVAAVPEGLPAVSTTTLALELNRLREKKVIARRLHAIEGLGALRTLCFDKTGTLTENSMSVGSALLGDRPVEVTDEGLAQLLEAGVLCSDVEIGEGTDGPVLKGSGTEAAIVALALEAGLDGAGLSENWPRTDARLRNHARRYMATFHECEGRGRVAAKGDPVSILGKCHGAVVDGAVVDLTDERRARIRAGIDAMASNGQRVLGFASADCGGSGEGDTDWFETPLIWLGALGLANPLREGTAEVIAGLQRAGIRTVMITGDQAATAGAIARELGLSGAEPLQILDASDLSELPPDLLSALARNTHVFARVSPAQKLDIVRALQADGSVVGMTGDGFNDAPAMKAADVAIAIGADSAGAARDVADIVVDGAHIRHIADGVAYGRTVRSNVRKSVRFMLSTNLAEILMIVAETAIKGDQIESPLELLWLNLVTDVLPGLGLALELPEPDVMETPRHTMARIFDNEDLRHSAEESAIIAGVTLAAHLVGLARYGPGPRTRSLTLFTMVAAQMAHAYSCRAERDDELPQGSFFSNRTLNMAVGGATGLQILPILLPGLRNLLGIGPMGVADFAVAAGAGGASFGLVETLKARRQALADAENDAANRERESHA